MAECRNYRKGTKCLYFYKCSGADEQMQVGTSMKKLEQHGLYCLKTPGVRKIARISDFTGRTPKWCPLGRDEK